MEERLQPHQFDRLHDPGIADDPEVDAGIAALLGDQHQSAQTGGIDEIDPTEIEHQGQGQGAAVVVDEILKLFL